MADQNVRITNLPDSGSRENVAYRLWRDMSYALPTEGTWEERVKRSLDLYATCLQATNYNRKTKLEL